MTALRMRPFFEDFSIYLSSKLIMRSASFYEYGIGFITKK